MALFRTRPKAFTAWDGGSFMDRWRLDVGLSRGPSVSWIREFSAWPSGIWQDAQESYGIWVNKYWAWGADHSWYDGEICSWSFGFIHFSRMRMPCKRCQGTI